MPRVSINPWIIAIAVVVPTFMEVLDTTIANVALHQIAGGLSAAVTDSEWVITSDLAANAIILPISGWISARLGRRNYFILSIAVFTHEFRPVPDFATSPEPVDFSSASCKAWPAAACSRPARRCCSTVFPRRSKALAMTLFGVAALLAPIIGPTLGGYLTDNYSWRWIFYINLPVGIIAVLASWFLLEDPDSLEDSSVRT